MGKKYFWMILTLAIFTFAGGRLMRYALGQASGGNVYDPTGNTPLTAGNNVQFQHTGAGYKIDVSSGAAPNGSPPRVIGYSGTNVSESETVGGDSTVTRTGPNAYLWTNTGINGAVIPASKPALASNGSSQLAAATMSGTGTTVMSGVGPFPNGNFAKFGAAGDIVNGGAGTSNPAYSYNPASCTISANAITPLCTNNVAETVCSESISANLTVNLSTSSCAAGQRLILIVGQTAGGLSITYSNTGVAEIFQANCNASGTCNQPALSGNGKTDVFQFSYDTVPATPSFREISQALNVTPNFVLNPMSTLGQMIYQGASSPQAVSGPTTNPGVPYTLSETSSGGLAQAPAFAVNPVFDFPANSASTAPILNEAVIDSPAGVTVATITTLSNQIKGLCIANCATSGNSEIVVSGQVSGIFDGAITQGDYFVPSTTTGGKLHDSGIAYAAGTACPIANGAMGVISAATNGAPGSTPQLVDFDKTLCLAVGELLALNNSATGTILNGLVSLTGSPSTAVKTTHGSTAGAVGICVSGCGTSGMATIIQDGTASAIFDGATIAGDYVGISTSVDGDVTDAGSSYPTSGQVVGRVLSGNAGAGTYQIVLFDEIQGPFDAGKLSTGTLAAGRGGAGTNNGILKANGSGTVSAAIAATDYAAATTGGANTPLFNNGSGGFTNGTRAGNTTTVATTSGTLTNGHIANFDVNGNIVDGGVGTTLCTPTAGQLPIGNAGGTAFACITLSGDGVVTSAGVLTISRVNGAAIPTSATVLGSNGSNQIVSATTQGNGSKVQLSTGTTTNGHLVSYDANGNTIDSGVALASVSPLTAAVVPTVAYGGL